MSPACNTSNDKHIGASIPYSLSKGSYKDSDVLYPCTQSRISHFTKTKEKQGKQATQT
jgi:hypothetical protein